MRLKAYYYGFDFTGCDPVDRILEAVARAGKSAHHTDDWNTPDGADGLSPADRIQQAAQAAAEAFNAKRSSP